MLNICNHLSTVLRLLIKYIFQRLYVLNNRAEKSDIIITVFENLHEQIDNQKQRRYKIHPWIFNYNLLYLFPFIVFS